jgi:hypothetical protein
VKPPIVYDATALLELFNAHPVAMRYWEEAGRTGLVVVFPAGAIAEANKSLKASYSAWTTVLWSDTAKVAPLDISSAVETGLNHRHDIATSHVAHEAQQISGLVLTASPDKYSGGDIRVLVI